MLLQLLALVAEGRVATVPELARRLGAGENLVIAMLEDLARRGWLQTIDACTSACDRCGVRSCAMAGHGRAFALSDAGRAALEHRS